MEVLLFHDKSRVDSYGGISKINEMYTDGLSSLNLVAAFYSGEVRNTGEGFDAGNFFVVCSEMVAVVGESDPYEWALTYVE